MSFSHLPLTVASQQQEMEINARVGQKVRDFHYLTQTHLSANDIGVLLGF